MKLSRFFRRKEKAPLIPFAEDRQITRIAPLLEDFLKGVLYDEEPLFVSDEASIWDVYSGTEEQELLSRCSAFYGVPVYPADLKQPLWSLIEQLAQRRTEPPDPQTS